MCWHGFVAFSPRRDDTFGVVPRPEKIFYAHSESCLNCDPKSRVEALNDSSEKNNPTAKESNRDDHGLLPPPIIGKHDMKLARAAAPL